MCKLHNDIGKNNKIEDEIEIMKNVDIVDVISSYIPLMQKGSIYYGICPFHNDAKESLFVSPEKQIFKCFECNIGGNVFTFVEKYENVSFEKAVDIVKNKMYEQESIIWKQNYTVIEKEKIYEYIDNSTLIHNPIVIYGKEDDIKKCLDDVKEHIKINRSLVYVTGENLISDIDNTNIDEVDIFILDNVEKLQNDINAQYKLFNIFNRLHDTNKQMIITTTILPHKLENFEQRLITRLNWGAIVEL